MGTSIVAAVRKLLLSPEATMKISVELVFLVSSDAVSSAYQGESKDPSGLSVIPGVATGEGCSINGGCASCPYMKMNFLSLLLRVCHNPPDKENNSSAYVAGRFSFETPLGYSVADVGCELNLHMRHFQATKELPEKLVSQILCDTSAEGR